MSYGSTAARVAKHKAESPHLFCERAGCLWRVSGRMSCPKHGVGEIERKARVLAGEWWNGKPWVELDDQQRRDALVEAAHYPIGAL